MSEENRNSSRARQADTNERYLAFQLSAEHYAIPLLQVKEVIEMSPAVPIPKMPNYFKGVINLRGQVISVIDLRVKLQMNKVVDGPKTAIVILDLGPDISIGIIVDRINSVQAFQQEHIGPAPEMLGVTQDQYLAGVARREDKLTLILNIHTALGAHDIHAAKAASAAKLAA